MKFLVFGSLIPNEKWMHVSCFIDGDLQTPLQVGKNILQGTLYSEEQTYYYSYKQSENLDRLRYTYLTESKWQIPESRLTVTLGGFNFTDYWYTVDREYDGVFFEDLRVWSRYLPPSELMV